LGFPFTAEELDRARAAKCPMCKAAPGVPCRSTIGDDELARIVHFVRLELSGAGSSQTYGWDR
jgi:hypothetical protein